MKKPVHDALFVTNASPGAIERVVSVFILALWVCHVMFETIVDKSTACGIIADQKHSCVKSGKPKVSPYKNG